MFWPLVALYVLIAASHLRLSARLDAIEDRLRKLERPDSEKSRRRL